MKVTSEIRYFAAIKKEGGCGVVFQILLFEDSILAAFHSVIRLPQKSKYRAEGWGGSSCKALSWQA
jgi:hypothetical protein